MKKFFTIVTLAAMTLVGQAQVECIEQEEPNYNGNEAGCRQAVSLYTEFLKQENFKDASKEWWKAQEICPQYKPLLYDNGKYIYKKMAQAITDKNSEDFKNKMDSLNLIYDLWFKNYAECPELQMKRAHDNMMDETHRYNVAFEYFQKAFENTPDENIESYDVVYYFRAAYFMVGAKLIDCGQMMEIYEKLEKISNDKLEQNEAAGNSGEAQNWKTTLQTLESYIVPCASCEILLPIYKKKTDAAPEDIDLAEEVLGKLNDMECNDPYLLELAILIDKARPTHKSKMDLGNTKYGSKDYSEALDYYLQALEFDELSEENRTKANERLAQIYLNKGSYKNAYNYASKVSGCQAKYIQAQAVAQSAGSCANNKLERSAIYSYALDLAEEAGSCVSSSWISSIENGLMTTSEAFIKDLKAGDSVEVPCWGRKVKLRTNG
ncbi:hypothetical protein [Parvicella tangerina]|uniref:Tetratricopeptide repeat protein n=1 Tax=Parvicella tangerina TaxID=2829795 RepID=A0A916JQY4_9FLAO|nr:hypothetical protein [Parvicella tangerina]CAG5087870.1 hypothetical protein CRYO30217_03605 [Parvicella tangerina]